MKQPSHAGPLAIIRVARLGTRAPNVAKLWTASSFPSTAEPRAPSPQIRLCVAPKASMIFSLNAGRSAGFRLVTSP